MKITPIEIRQKVFQKKSFNGIDRDEVQTFLTEISVAWEKMLDEMADMQMQLDNSEQERLKLKAVESSLYKTLKAAEDTSASIVAEAKKESEDKLKETEKQAEDLLSDARTEARKIIEQAEAHSNNFITELREEMQALELDLRKMETLRNTLLADIKKTAGELLEKAESAASKITKVEFPNLEVPKSTEEAERIKRGDVKALVETRETQTLLFQDTTEERVTDDKKNLELILEVEETGLKLKIETETEEQEPVAASQSTIPEPVVEAPNNQQKSKSAKQGSFFDTI